MKLKHALHIVILIFIAVNMTAQPKILPQRLGTKIITAYTGGAADGMVELLRNNYYRFEQVHPHANSSFWNPDESWKNKWRNGDPEQGERFLGSSTVFAWSTDAYHLLRTADRMSTTISVTLYIFEEKRPWYYLIIEGAAYWVIRQLGFHTTYSLIHKR
ncbi:MAG: hypothetical protein KF852_04170 [Saprospiraceae bacterium]|nr:hypothetical protein [Saprospiraceae bacterium]